MSSAELCGGTDAAQQFLDHLTLELNREGPLLSHGKILSTPYGRKILPGTLT